jgi:hypothetical protein
MGQERRKLWKSGKYPLASNEAFRTSTCDFHGLPIVEQR